MSQRVKVSITAVKDLEKLVEFLEKNGANIAEFFRTMNAGKPFVFHLDTSYYSQHKQELEKLCEYQEEKAEAQSSYGLTAIMLTDALIVLLISSYFVDGLELKNVLVALYRECRPEEGKKQAETCWKTVRQKPSFQKSKQKTLPVKTAR